MTHLDDESDAWARRLSGTIGAEVLRRRKAAGLSAQALSDRCGRTGHPLPRNVIVNMETGRRASTPVSDVVVLAYALQVPPMLLLYPVGRVADVEVLPDHRAHPWAAARWFFGLASLVDGPAVQEGDPLAPGFLGAADPGGGPLTDAGDGTMVRAWENFPEHAPSYAGAGPTRLYELHAAAEWEWQDARALTAQLGLDDDVLAGKLEVALRARAVERVKSARDELRGLRLALPEVQDPQLAVAVGADVDGRP